MRLDNFDRKFLNLEGYAKDIMLEQLGVDVSEKTAEGHIAGIRHYLKHKESMEAAKDAPDDVSYKFAEDGSKTIQKVIVLSESEMNDPSTIMNKMGLDPVMWEMITCELDRKAYQVTMKLSQGTDEHGHKKEEIPRTETNYAFDCKVRVKPKTDKINSDVIREVLREVETPKIKEYKYKTSEKMLELPVMDLHLGKHAWGEETGAGNFDIKIAEALYKKTIRDFLSRTDKNYHKILFPVGQDFYHIDDKGELTTAGTHVDTDGRWQKIYRTGVELLIWTIEHLRKRAPVEVMYVPGNHDEMLSYCAVVSLFHRYNDTESVLVDLAPTPRKYRKFGLGMVGFSHGKEGRKSRLEKIMQVEQPEMWGATRFREMHLGDQHHEKVWETGGIIFRRIPTITETDAWHNEKAFKGAVRKAQAFVWDKNKGIVDIVNSVVEVKQMD